jgi:hypothetical protein
MTWSFGRGALGAENVCGAANSFLTKVLDEGVIL